MKKLLAIVMVLGLVSVASASLSVMQPVLSGTTDVTTAPVGPIVLDLVWQYGGTGVGLLDNVDLILTIEGEATFNRAVTADLHSALTTNGQYNTSDVGLPEGGLFLSGTAFGAGTGVANGSLAFMGIAIDATGPATISVKMDGQYFTGACSVDAGAEYVDYPNSEIGTFTVVPEPITMTLLGLGGLIAIRRRRA